MSNLETRTSIDSTDIENMILSTFLFLNDLALDGEIDNDLFKLDDRVFTSLFRKRVAEQINSVEDEAYSFLSYQIEEKCKDTQFEMNLISILVKNSLPLKVVKKYHDALLEKNKFKDIVWILKKK